MISLLARLRSRFAAPSASAAERASLGFALGRLLDGSGEYAAAFRAYAAAKRDSRASVAHPVRYDRQAHAALIERLLQSATAAAMPARPEARRAPLPIFICGMFRSGSTLTEQLLCGDPGVCSRRRTGFPAAPGGRRACALSRIDAHSGRPTSLPTSRNATWTSCRPLSGRDPRDRQAPRQLPLHRPHQAPVPGCQDRAHDPRSTRQLPVDLLPAPGSRDELRARPAGYRPLFPPVSAPDGALEAPLRGRHLRLQL